MSAKNHKSPTAVEISKSFSRKSDKKMKFISWYYKFTESAILNYFKMPSTPYDLVRDDQDLRIPLHAEQAFFHGISFQAKVSTATIIVILFRAIFFSFMAIRLPHEIAHVGSMTQNYHL